LEQGTDKQNVPVRMDPNHEAKPPTQKRVEDFYLLVMLGIVGRDNFVGIVTRYETEGREGVDFPFPTLGVDQWRIQELFSVQGASFNKFI
jgi:hypothetical protein